ncbi:hypothetical protein M0813_01064 [Anaeramoeba flamelloides]|uniref:SEC7 domain-containing protein n=1 Tax=Anaeramoeba flamelloides TaxID=1746091 RepID=A0ABQ8X142_9EUKA|nr:hypothetical protein M0813_01064 [Anaeramoeba flamelloides]
MRKNQESKTSKFTCLKEISSRFSDQKVDGCSTKLLRSPPKETKQEEEKEKEKKAKEDEGIAECEETNREQKSKINKQTGIEEIANIFNKTPYKAIQHCARSGIVKNDPLEIAKLLRIHFRFKKDQLASIFLSGKKTKPFTIIFQ